MERSSEKRYQFDRQPEYQLILIMSVIFSVLWDAEICGTHLMSCALFLAEMISVMGPLAFFNHFSTGMTGHDRELIMDLLRLCAADFLQCKRLCKQQC